ncbi:hypothetical protein [Actinoplanes sp. NPDC049118]|uniref:hypothetical protein n=1 Tax=Actinoplanes sp. NPDC049118 TaxID=3155769 RepID=UPI0033F4762C
MHSRFVSTLAVVGTALAGGLVPATAASASIRFDPAKGTGYVGRNDVQAPFRWSNAVLQARAAGITFSHSRSIEDVYSVVCGWDKPNGGRDHVTIVVTHPRLSTRVYLRSSVAYDASSVSSAEPRGRVVGFRLTGAVSGVSGTSVGPAVGAPCPEGRGQSGARTIDRVRLKSSTTISALTASYKGVDRDLRVTRS